MSTIGLKPGDAVVLSERRGNECPAYNALVVNISMDEQLTGPLGEMSITAAFVVPDGDERRVLVVDKIVHVTHADWLEGRAGLAYDELPYPTLGVCRFCLCTENRACPGGCSWLDLEGTCCNAPACKAKFLAEAGTEIMVPIEMVTDVS